MALDKEFETEFLVYLSGEMDENNHIIIVKDIYIPEQEVTYSSVDVKEPVAHKFNGVLHKHPTGVKDFSNIDDAYINVNHRFSILLENHDYRTAIVLQKVPCGHYLITRASVKVSTGIDTTAFVEEAKKKIKEKIYEVVTHYPRYTHGWWEREWEREWKREKESEEEEEIDEEELRRLEEQGRIIYD